MRKYRIHMNGKIYEMEIELVEENEPTEMPKKVLSDIKYGNNSPSNSFVQVIDPSANKEILRKNNSVMSLMPGTVIKINTSVGDFVEKGNIIMVLEAMKMENEIPAPRSGIIKGIFIKEGQTVQTGEVLFEME